MHSTAYHSTLSGGSYSSSASASTGSSSSMPPSGYRSNATSSQLRSTFGSSASSAYVTRSHLPFVSQSMLVAHCYTSSPSPSAARASYIPSKSYTSTPSSYLSSVSGLSSYGGGGSSISSSSSYSGHFSGSRPASTKRLPSSTTSSYSYATSYSSPKSYTSSTSSYRSSRTPSASSYIANSSTYRRPSPTSYYQPIRLRERPLLTQISRQINARASIRSSSNSNRSDNSSNNYYSPRSTQQSHSETTDNQKASREKAEIKANETETSQRDKLPCPEEADESWSSDLARNISRNKYLIKFREFDRRPTVSPESIELVPPLESPKETEPEKDHTRPEASEAKLDHTPEVPVSGSAKGNEGQTGTLPEMRLPVVAETVRLGGHDEPHQLAQVAKAPILSEAQITSDCDRRVKVTEERQQVELGTVAGAPTAEVALPGVTKSEDAKPEKKKRNIKLKLKPLAGGKAEGQAEALVGPKKKAASSPRKPSTPPEASGATPTETDAGGASPKSLKARRLVKKASNSKASPEAPTIASGGAVAAAAGEQTSEPPAPTKAKKTGSEQPTEALASASPKAEAAARKPLALKQEAASSVAKAKPLKAAGAKLAERKATKAKQEAETDTSKAAKPTTSSSGNLISSQISPLAASSASDKLGLGADRLANNPASNKRIKFRDYHYEDFNFLSVLGHGGWGFVVLAELKDHDACFAVKCIKKITIVEDDDFESIMIERKVLALGNVHPFICKLFCTFETEGYLFFVMEYCAGGDLMFHVQREGKFTESRCRFYAAEIICAIRFLHNKHIIYRDLKLDNILLDSLGHVRLVDFGMCQLRTYREEMLPSNFCGTPEYISPEIIKGVPYNHSVDWWSFGVLLYEMAVGKMPFRGNDENELLWNVCYEQIHYPMFLTRELTTLLQLLMEREPTKRMGMATCKAGDIYDQPWFRGVDWKGIEEQRVPPPFVPDVKSKRDVQNFDTDFTQSACELSPVDESVLRKIDQNLFQKFPYTNPEICLFE